MSLDSRCCDCGCPLPVNRIYRRCYQCAWWYQKHRRPGVKRRKPPAPPKRQRMVCPLIPDVRWNPAQGWHGRNLWQHLPLPTGRWTIIDSTGKRRRLKHPRLCLACGVEFRVHAPSVNKRFCSPDCRLRARSRESACSPGKLHGPTYIPPRDCVKCGEPMYYPNPSRKRHAECARRHHIARTMELYETAYSTGRVKRAMRWRYELVDYLRERDGDDCALCGDPMDFTVTTGPRGESDDGPTVDHIIPRSLGGSNDLANLQLAHWRCNRAKGNRVVGFEQLRLVG